MPSRLEHYVLLIACVTQLAVVVAYAQQPQVECPCHESWKGAADYFDGKHECAHGPETNQNCRDWVRQELPICQAQLNGLKDPPNNWTQQQIDSECMRRILANACFETNGAQPVLVNGQPVECRCFECGNRNGCEEYNEKYGARCHGNGNACTMHQAQEPMPFQRHWDVWLADPFGCNWDPATDGGLSPIDPGCAFSDQVVVGCLTEDCPEVPGSAQEFPGLPMLCGPVPAGGA